MDNDNMHSAKHSNIIGVIVRLVLVGVIVVAGVVIAKRLIDTAPKADKKASSEKSVPVLTTILKLENSCVTVSAMGTVIAAEKVIVKPRVSGDIVSLNPRFKDGAIIKAGNELVEIDPQDYILLVEDMKNKLIQADGDLRIEMGRQRVAKHELESLERDLNDTNYDLALRKPQLMQSQAAVALAKINLQKAELQLKRTKIRMPFDGVVIEKNVGLGSQVSPQTPIATVVRMDEFWIQAKVPIEDLQQFDIPSISGSNGADVIINYGANHTCKGKVIKLLHEVDTKGRMAKVLIEVKNPLELNYPLLLGAYVRVQIQGRKLTDIIKVPRSNIHNSNNIWIYDSHGILDILTVKPLWVDRDFAYIPDGDLAGKKLIVSDLSVPVKGMRILERNSTLKTKLGAE